VVVAAAVVVVLLLLIVVVVVVGMGEGVVRIAAKTSLTRPREAGWTTRLPLARSPFKRVGWMQSLCGRARA